MQELSAIRDSILELRTAEIDLLAQRERVKATQTEWRRIPQPGEPPQAPAANDTEPVAAARLAAMAETALSALVEARAAGVQATRELHKARAADEAMRELEWLFRQDASLRVAVEATESTLTELLDETIRPLAVEVDQRWKRRSRTAETSKRTRTETSRGWSTGTHCPMTRSAPARA